MAAPEGFYFYNASGGTISTRDATDIQVELKGITVDGYDIYHIMYARLGSHSTYDAVKIKRYYHYITGSGFTLYDGHPNPSKWDTATPMTWLDARYHKSHDLIQVPKE